MFQILITIALLLLHSRPRSLKVATKGIKPASPINKNISIAEKTRADCFAALAMTQHMRPGALPGFCETRLIARQSSYVTNQKAKCEN